MNILGDFIETVKDEKERQIFRRLNDFSYRTMKTHQPSFSEFMDPFSLGKVNSVLKRLTDINVCFFGGCQNFSKQSPAH